jgi:hypothetical protein
MSATPFADQRTTAGDTFMGRSRIIYNFGFCKPLCIPTVYPLIPRVAPDSTHCDASDWGKTCALAL